ANRYQTTCELAEELDRYVAGEPILARPRGLPIRLYRQAKRHKVVASLVAALVVVFFGGIGLVLHEWQRAEDGRRAASTERDGAELARGEAEKAALEAKRAL